MPSIMLESRNHEGIPKCVVCGDWVVQFVTLSVFVSVLLDEIRCLCPDIPFVNLTEAPPSGCFQIGARFRYKCKVGYKRQAGTSNLIKCTQNGDTVEWTPHNLKCKCKLFLLIIPWLLSTRGSFLRRRNTKWSSRTHVIWFLLPGSSGCASATLFPTACLWLASISLSVLLLISCFTLKVISHIRWDENCGPIIEKRELVKWLLLVF